MSRSLARVWPLLVALALLALPAGAEIYTITLTNGTVVETAQQPQEATWDSNLVLFLTDVGNWVGVTKAEIESVRSETQRKGYGIRISDSTVAIGWAPNDLPTEEEAAQGRGGVDRAADALDRMAAQAEQDRNYSINQFVEPDSTQGMPSRFVGGGFGSDPIEPDPGRFLTDAPPPQQ
ncbi:MAG TPA: hypothetical protein VJ725_30655 [Thermoanaerobaculia bacterium]|nr:hypothetical protein [Thermoanaerobaculia bacterium]